MELWHGPQDSSAGQEELIRAGLTDGLPVVLPTPERVERMINLHRLAADEVVATLVPLFAEVTWQDIAINAVMAGCLPEYLPVVGAAIEAMAAEEYNLMGIATTTGMAAPFIIVNGPIAKKLGINAEGNVLGPGNRANATIGRAVNLVLSNAGGMKPGEVDMATLGAPAKYTCCLAENEAASPWPPLHAERGYDAGASVVTVVGAVGIVEVLDSASNQAEDLAKTFAESMLIPGSLGMPGWLGGSEPLIILPPDTAMIFARNGYSKQQVQAAIQAQAQMPLARLSPAVRKRLLARRSAAGASDPEAPLQVADRPADVMIVVAGGTGNKAAYVPTWPGTTRAVSRPIRTAA